MDSFSEQVLAVVTILGGRLQLLHFGLLLTILTQDVIIEIIHRNKNEQNKNDWSPG